MRRQQGRGSSQQGRLHAGGGKVLSIVTTAVVIVISLALWHSGKTSSFEEWLAGLLPGGAGDSNKTASLSWRTSTGNGSGTSPTTINPFKAGNGVSHEFTRFDATSAGRDTSLREGAAERTNTTSRDSNNSLYGDSDSLATDDSRVDDTANDEPQTFIISGWVRTETAEPVAGIAVTSVLKRSFQSPQGTTFGAAQTIRNTVTDANGAFAFGSLADGEYEVSTAATGYYDAAMSLVRAGTNSLVIVVRDAAYRDITLIGVVNSTDGRPLAGTKVASIGVKTDGPGYTDTAGNYAMYLPIRDDSRTYTVRFTLEGYRERLLPLQITESNEATSFQLDAVLEPLNALATVSGSVTSSDGAPVHGAVIQLLSPSRRHTYQAVSDRTGYFILPDVEVGHDYRLWARSEGYRDYLQEGLAVSPSGSQFMVKLDSLSDGRLTGQMTDSEGNPIPNFTLWVRSSYTSAAQVQQVTGDAAGMFTVDNLPEGRISLSSMSSPYLSVSGIELTAGATQQVRVMLDRGQYQTVAKILNPRGEPVPGAQATLIWSYEANGIHSQSSRKTAADASGLLHFSQLGPGTHTLIVEAPGFRTARVDYGVGTNGAPMPITLAER